MVEGLFGPEEIKYLKSLSAVAEATAKRITYTDDFKALLCSPLQRRCLTRAHEFREAGLDPALIGNTKRIERCLARWRESQDEILNSGNAKAGADSSFSARGRGRTKHSGECASSESLARLGGIVTSGWYRQRIRFPRIARNVAPSSSPSPQRAEQ